jgi:hypothetical protein
LKSEGYWSSVKLKEVYQLLRDSVRLYSTSVVAVPCSRMIGWLPWWRASSWYPGQKTRLEVHAITLVLPAGAQKPGWTGVHAVWLALGW